MVARGEWDILWLGRTSNSMHLFGKSFIDIADAMHKQPLDAYLDILQAEGPGIADAGMFGEVKTHDHLRELVRQALARPMGAQRAVAPSHPRTFAPSGDFSHSLFVLPTGSDSEAPCIIEPSVMCNHCGYCKSYGH